MREPASHPGGCHCGAVRFVVLVRRYEALDCNCSICKKKAFLHLIVPRSDFSIVQGESELTSYTFNTGVARHLFCKHCGVHPFYVPRSHPDGIDVNVRCLDGDAAGAFEITPFDGANWEDSVDQIRQP